MKHIAINEEILKWAYNFRTELETATHGYEPPAQKLEELKTYVQNDKTKSDYVDEILKRWSDLIVARPNQFENFIGIFEPLISADGLKEKVIVKVMDKKLHRLVDKEMPFHKAIVEAMRYDRVQSHIYPTYMRLLGIRTCVYCNAQYAFSIAGDENYQNYDIDHLWPKSKHPYLCTSFFNLQPSCPTCNRKKGKKEAGQNKKLFNLFVEEGEPLDATSFRLDNESIINYLLSPSKDAENLKIIFSCKGDMALERMFNSFFHISTLYQAHTDIAEELIWKRIIYNKAYQDVFKRQFRKLGIQEKDFNRFLLGNYDLVENIHMRPLSKMMQDIGRQLRIIK